MRPRPSGRKESGGSGESQRKPLLLAAAEEDDEQGSSIFIFLKFCPNALVQYSDTSLMYVKTRVQLPKEQHYIDIIIDRNIRVSKFIYSREPAKQQRRHVGESSVRRHSRLRLQGLRPHLSSALDCNGRRVSGPATTAYGGPAPGSLIFDFYTLDHFA